MNREIGSLIAGREKSGMFRLALREFSILARLFDIFWISRARLTNISSGIPDLAGKVNVFLNVDLSSATTQVGQILTEIQNVSGVEATSMIGPRNILSEPDAVPALLGVSVILSLAPAFSKLAEKAPTFPDEVILVWKDFGTNEIQTLRQASSSLDSSAMLELFFNYWHSAGRGKVTLLAFEPHPNAGAFKIENSFEQTRAGNKVACLLTLAITTGALSEIFQASIAVREASCVSRGDSFCKFEFSRLI